jgi:hypothetical protein
MRLLLNIHAFIFCALSKVTIEKNCSIYSTASAMATFAVTGLVHTFYIVICIIKSIKYSSVYLAFPFLIIFTILIFYFSQKRSRIYYITLLKKKQLFTLNKIESSFYLI